MPEQATLTDLRGAGRPASSQPVPWQGARVPPGGPWRLGREWMAQGACTAPQVDPNWFTVEETAPDAATAIARAKAICRACPVRL
jgi:Transcription factor WhiB